MTTQTVTYVTPDEYLAAERLSETRSEYLDGGVYPMTGGTANHIRIVSNIDTQLNIQLDDRPCDIFPIDMKVRLPGSRKFFYPDVVVVCGELQYHDSRKDIITNPDLVVEVLSPSTEAFDRGAKFEAYQTIDSLKEYLLFSQDKPRVEQFVRNGDGKWTYAAVEGLESSLALPSIECTLNLSAVYKRVEF
ncbi:MAG TPA: Uma2 family endonuclease [Pyrinomonadaceae bacterium]|jgi:Uma2 family endonuclease|nr:Uma2 family endonuclease [Pyrinomonadaceae bacterium]